MNYNNLALRANKIRWQLVLLLGFLSLFSASCKKDHIRVEDTEKQSFFSPDSQSKIRSLFQHNIKFPVEAKNKNISGKFFLIIQMNKGGQIDSIYTSETDLNANFPVVCTNNILSSFDKNSAKSDENYSYEIITNKLKILENEGIRVTRMLESLNLPEWQEKRMKFAVAFNFQIKGI
jgi:hypothetical protein